MSSTKPSCTILMTACAGVSDSSTSAPTARSRMEAMKSLTTIRLTSASSSATRTSRRTSETSASVNLPRERSRAKIAFRRSLRFENTVLVASAGANSWRGRAQKSRRLFADLLDIPNGVADGLDLLGFLVRDVEIEFRFQRHDELDLIKRIGSQIVRQRSVGRHFAFVHTELLDDDLLDLIEH